MAKYLYVKEDVAYAEYFIAPDISSLAYAAYYGAYLGELTGRTVQGISGDNNTFLEFKAKDGETYYVVSTLPYWESQDTLKDDKPVSGGTNTNTNTNSSNTFGKILDVAKGLFGILGGGSNKTVATDTKDSEADSSSDTEGTPPEEQENKYLAFLKKNIVWFLPTVILVPILLFWLIRWAIRKMKKPQVTPTVTNGV